MEKATFGAGYFWGVETGVRQVKGVTFKNPTYHDVCTGRTGHAEVVEVEYDPIVITYEEMLELFWKIHDPTPMNREGPDIGTQYRSAIFYHPPEKQLAAIASKNKLQRSGCNAKPLVTEITPVSDSTERRTIPSAILKRPAGRAVTNLHIGRSKLKGKASGFTFYIS